MKKAIIIFILGLILILSKFWLGIYEDNEFGEKRVFIKHRPIWKTYFYSPRGMRDVKLSQMSEERRVEQLMFDEFVELLHLFGH